MRLLLIRRLRVNEETMQRINVLYLITELNIGGAEKVVAKIAAHLQKDRYNALVSCLYDPGLVADEILKSGIQVVNLGARDKWDVGAAGRLFRLLKRENIQILHSHLFHANLLGRIAGKMAGVPIIISTRHNVELGGKGRELLNRWTIGCSDVTIAVSEQVRDAEMRWMGLSPRRLVTIYNGIDIERFKNLDPKEANAFRHELHIDQDAPLIGVIARFHRQKGHSILLDTSPSILDRFPSAKILLVGEGGTRVAIEEKVQKLGLSDFILPTGIRQDIPHVLSALDLFVLPSLWEGMPIVLLEAMAAGLPVVATRVGGVPELVEDGATGLLVPAHDPEALAKAIIALLQDRERAEAMGQAGRERVERYFSVERMVQQTEALYEELVREKMGLEWAEGEGWQSTENRF